MTTTITKAIFSIAVLLSLLFMSGTDVRAEAAPQAPSIELRLNGAGSEQNKTSAPVQIFLLLTLLTFIPAMLISVTCFTRMIVIFHFLRQALGTQEMPSNQILLGLTLFLTMFVMAPVGEKVYSDALGPAIEGKIDYREAFNRASVPMRQFMLRYTREKDLALFIRMARLPQPKTVDEVPFRVVVPAFMISELKTAFQIGFVLFLPFLVIDMVVSAVLLSMGMIQLPPVMISAPFKILLFIIVDGWNLIVGSMVRSYF